MNKRIYLSDIMKMKDFIKFEEPILFNDFNAVGLFPYEKAQLNYIECVAVPRNLYESIEDVLRKNSNFDNKVVVVFEDHTNFGTDNFAIQFKDSYCKIGMLNQIMGYAGRDLM